MNSGELHFSTSLDIAGKPAGVFAFEDLSGGFVSKGFDHLRKIPDSVFLAKEEMVVAEVVGVATRLLPLSWTPKSGH